MFGITLTEFLLFLRVVSIAVAGAASFWGLVFVVFSRKFALRLRKRGDLPPREEAKGPERAKRVKGLFAQGQARRLAATQLTSPDESDLWYSAAQKLLWIFFLSLFFFTAVWVILAVHVCAFCVSAHEGISLGTDMVTLSHAIRGQFPWFFLLTGFWGLGVILVVFARRFLLSHLALGYGFVFLMISIFLLWPWERFDTIVQAISSALHNWHAILTFGSVVTVDFLYIALRSRFQPLLPRIFSFVTKGIWVGLGLDFLSSGLVFREAFFLADKLLFSQTLIGIVIINGVFLSGPFARAILSHQQRAGNEIIPSKLRLIVGISGSISLVAWVGNGALDTFRNLTLSYRELFGFYIGFVILVFILHYFFDHFVLERKKAQP